MNGARNCELISMIANGDMAALTELYNDTSKDIFAFALSILKNYSLAEDTMHDVFLKIRFNASKFRGEKNANAWLLRITRNTAYDYLRKQKHEITSTKCSNNGATPDNYDYIFIKDILNKLTEYERQIVSLYLISNIPQKEIAHLLELPLTTVKWRYRIALEKLRYLYNE